MKSQDPSLKPAAILHDKLLEPDQLDSKLAQENNAGQFDAPLALSRPGAGCGDLALKYLTRPRSLELLAGVPLWSGTVDAVLETARRRREGAQLTHDDAKLLADALHRLRLFDARAPSWRGLVFWRERGCP